MYSITTNIKGVVSLGDIVLKRYLLAIFVVILFLIPNSTVIVGINSSYTISETVNEENKTDYLLTVPETVDSGLYDLYIELENGTRYWIPRSVWVLPTEGFTKLRIAHISDLHFLGIPAENQHLRFVGLLLTQLFGADLVIETGDNADTASIPQYIESRGYHWAFMYSTPLLLVPGNHDFGTSNWEVYYGPREWYRLIGDRILVVGIDTLGEGLPKESSLKWLEEVLANNTDVPIKIVLMHHPVFYWQGELVTNYQSKKFRDPHQYRDSPLSYYWGANISMARWLLRLCEDYNVTMVMAGHINRDQYVKYVSNRTGTVTYFITTTTMAQSRPNYNGLQIIDLLMNGNFTFPYAPPTFIGFGGDASVRSRVYNSIPDDPTWDVGYFYGRFLEGNTAYDFILWNNLYSDSENVPISNVVTLALPWISEQAYFKVLSSLGNAHAEMLDYIVKDGILYALLNITMPSSGDMIEFIIYTAEDNTPPAAEFKLATPRPPKLNRSVTLYFDIMDIGWGIRNVTAYLIEDNQQIPIEVKKAAGLTYTLSVKVTARETVNRTIRLVVYDLAGNVYEQNYTFTFYAPGESGDYYYGPTEGLPEQPPEQLPSLMEFADPVISKNFGPGSPVIVYPGGSYIVEFKHALGDISRVYIAGVFREDNELVYREFDVSLVPYVPGMLTTTSPTTTTPTETPTTTPTTTSPTESPTSSPTETPPPTAPDYTMYIVILVIVVILIAVIAFLLKKR